MSVWASGQRGSAGAARYPGGNLSGTDTNHRVEFPDGSEKQYTASANIDYFSWDGQAGFRTKMQPTLEGTFLTSDDALPMEVLWRDERLFLSFRGDGAPWEEEVLKLRQDVLVTRHANGLCYEYSRYEPLLTPE